MFAIATTTFAIVLVSIFSAVGMWLFFSALDWFFAELLVQPVTGWTATPDIPLGIVPVPVYVDWSDIARELEAESNVIPIGIPVQQPRPELRIWTQAEVSAACAA